MHIPAALNSNKQSKRLIVSAAYVSLLMALITGPSASAEEPAPSGSGLGKINIQLSGTVVALACTVSPTDASKTVTMGDWATKQLQYPAGHSEPAAFGFHLTGCTASGVSLTFVGNKDPKDSTLLSLNGDSTATNVALEIMDTAHRRIAPGEDSTRVRVDSNGNATLNFSARYVPTAKNPTAGTANADSVFMLNYD